MLAQRATTALPGQGQHPLLMQMDARPMTQQAAGRLVCDSAFVAMQLRRKCDEVAAATSELQVLTPPHTHQRYGRNTSRF